MADYYSKAQTDTLLEIATLIKQGKTIPGSLDSIAWNTILAPKDEFYAATITSQDQQRKVPAIQAVFQTSQSVTYGLIAEGRRGLSIFHGKFDGFGWDFEQDYFSKIFRKSRGKLHWKSKSILTSMYNSIPDVEKFLVYAGNIVGEKEKFEAAHIPQLRDTASASKLLIASGILYLKSQGK